MTPIIVFISQPGFIYLAVAVFGMVLHLSSVLLEKVALVVVNSGHGPSTLPGARPGWLGGGRASGRCSEADFGLHMFPGLPVQPSGPKASQVPFCSDFDLIRQSREAR